MPTIKIIGPYRFFFYSGDKDEPPHIHVERDNHIAKFWLLPVRLQNSGRFKRKELNRIQKLVKENQRLFLEKRKGMSILVSEIQAVKAQEVNITDDTLSIDLDDGRTILVPLAWYPRLWYGRDKERQNWRLIGDGDGIHWPDLDEDIGVAGLLLGKRSGESQRSLNRWLEKRTQLRPGHWADDNLPEIHNIQNFSSVRAALGT